MDERLFKLKELSFKYVGLNVLQDKTQLGGNWACEQM